MFIYLYEVKILFRFVEILFCDETEKVYFRETIPIVPDSGSRDRVVVFVGAGCWGNLRMDAGNLEWGGNGEGLRKGRLVHE